jgi:hypothetical protein
MDFLPRFRRDLPCALRLESIDTSARKVVAFPCSSFSRAFCFTHDKLQ